MESFTIGALADAAGVNVETVRYYERRGLIEDPPRSASGYRQYCDEDLWRLQFIGRAKRLGFTLAEIGQMIPAGDGSSDAILAAARRKLLVVDERQRELATVRRRLEQLVDVCAGGDPADCAALDVVS